MSAELNLVTQLAIILVAAGAFTVISKALKQPVILGYIVAGFLVGPHLGIFPQFSAESVHEWSELGIIFLLFSLGLEFSFKKLLKVGSSALITAGTICAGMFVVGITTGGAMGWSTMESIFLGGMISMSSTTIILKVYDELGLKKRPYAGLIFGTLVVEDLIAVILLVLLSTLAVSNKFSGAEMAMGLLKLVFFLILWFLVGIYLIPTVLKKAKNYLTDEILLITGIGLCFGMVVLANYAGFSSALGAFVMGSILAETIEGERIGHLIGGIKDLFGAIFFVSVGMMLDPSVIAAHWGTILILAVVVMTGLLIFSSGGVMLTGAGLDAAVHTGFTMAQLGEFSFIIAGLGCSLGVLRDFIYPLVIAVSVITTFTTPYMIKAGDPALRWVRKVLPGKLLARLEASKNSRPASRAETSEWRQLIKSLLLRMSLYGVLIIAIMMATKLYVAPLAGKIMPDIPEFWQKIILVAFTLVVLFPFIYGFSISDGSARQHYNKLAKENPANKLTLLGIVLFRLLLGVSLVLTAVTMHINLSGWIVVIIIILLFFAFLLTKTKINNVSGMEGRFLSNLHEKEKIERSKAPVASSVKAAFAGYDVHTASFTVSPDFEFAGKTLREMPFRHTSGANIVKISRGSRNILIPSGNETIYPSDILLAVGSTEQLDAMATIMEQSLLKPDSASNEEFDTRCITLKEESHLTGKVLKDLEMRKSGVMVVSVMRGERLITNPGPDFKFEINDAVWLSGIKNSVEWFI